MKKIRLFDLPKTSTYVILSPPMQQIIMSSAVCSSGSILQLSRHLQNASKTYGLNYKNKAAPYFWAKLHRTAIPLWALIELSRLTNYTQEELEKESVRIRRFEGGTLVTLKFPLEITPEFDAVVAHLLGDGCFGTEKEHSASYKQKNKEARDLFVKKLKTAFGEFQINERQSEKYWTIIIPKIIIDIILSVYKFENTKTLHRRVPEPIKHKTKESKVAFLAAFILDEAHVGNGIEIYSGNKSLLEDIKFITESLNYDCAEIRKKNGHKSKNNYFAFRLRTKGCSAFLTDLQELLTRHPNCGLANKQRDLAFIANRTNHQSPFGQTKTKLLTELTIPTPLKELRFKLNLTDATLKEHLHKLEKRGLVTRNGKQGNAILWKTTA